MSPGTWALSATNLDEMLGTLSRISVLRWVLTGWLMTTFQMKTAGSPNKSCVPIFLPCPETGPCTTIQGHGTLDAFPLPSALCVGCRLCFADMSVPVRKGPSSRGLCAKKLRNPRRDPTPNVCEGLCSLS